MRPTRLGALAAGACAGRVCPRQRRGSGRHDRPRRTAQSVATHSGANSDTRVFGGDGTHRQHDGGMDGVDDRRRWRSDTRGSVATCAGRWRRGDAAGNRSTRRWKGVSAVARRCGERWRHDSTYPWGRGRARAAAVARDFRPWVATRRSNTTWGGWRLRASAERDIQTGVVGFRHGSGDRSTLYGAGVRAAVSAQRGAWHARWRQRANERVWRVEGEAGRWENSWRKKV
jgi:hypothetical protein